MDIEFTSMFGKNLKYNDDQTSSQRKLTNATDSHKNMIVYYKILKLEPAYLVCFFFSPDGCGKLICWKCTVFNSNEQTMQDHTVANFSVSGT